MKELPLPRSSSRNNPALRVALVYAIFSALWILFSDQLLLLLVSDPQMMTRIQMVKGWVFVLVTSLIIYVLLLREVARIVNVERALIDKEQDYLEVFNATNEGIIIHDADTGRIIDANLSFLKMFGLSRKQFPGLTMQELSLGEKPFNQQEAEKRIQLAKTEGPQMFEWRCRRADFELFWAEVTLKKARIGDVERVISVVRNVDDRKRAEEKSVVYEKRLQQAQKMEAIGTLAGGVAHDFNNILSAVLGYADLANEEIPEDSPATRHLREVIRAGNRAKELVKQILTFSRQNQSEQKPVLMQSIVKEAMKLLRASISTTIEIEMEIDDNCGPVLADPTQLHQVTMNLGTNAYYAMREKGGVLGVRLENIEICASQLTVAGKDLAAGKYIRLTVSDTGIGMEAEVFKKIFDPYFTTKTKGEGTGMGLSVVHGIISTLGGGIMVSSYPGAGTTFEVYLPANPQNTTRNVKVEVSETPGTGHILLVDDEEVLTDLGQRMLESFGYSVVALTDSRKAIELFRTDSDKFDIILTDLNMPHMDGITLVRECRMVDPLIPIILCTGYSELVDRDRALAEGVNDFLLKPVERRELAESIDKVLGRSRKGSERKAGVVDTVQ